MTPPPRRVAPSSRYAIAAQLLGLLLIAVGAGLAKPWVGVVLAGVGLMALGIIEELG